MKSPLLSVFLFSFFWALSILISKIGLNKGIEVMPYLIFSNITMFFMFAIFAIFRARPNTPPSRKTILKLTIYSLPSAIGIILMNIGYIYTSAINIGFLSKFTLVTTTLLASILLKERITGFKKIAIISMMIGAYLLSTGGNLIKPHIGDIFILVACFAFSLNSVLVKKLFSEVSVSGTLVSLIRTAINSVLIALACFSLPALFPPLSSLFNLQIPAWPLYMWALVLIRGIVTGASVLFMYATLKIATASYTTMMSMMTPVIVTILAFAFLGETFLFAQFVGGGLIVASGILAHMADTNLKRHGH